MSTELELHVPFHGEQEGEQVSVALPKAALTLRGTLSAHSASPREEIPDDEKPFDVPES